MSKPKKKKTRNAAPDPSTAGPEDWTPLFAAFRDAFEWALDVAKNIARDYPEEADAVERVRAFMRKRIVGEAAHIRVDDVMFTFALIIGAIERDLGPVEHLGPWFATPMRFPGAEQISRFQFPKHLAWSLGVVPARA